MNFKAPIINYRVIDISKSPNLKEDLLKLYATSPEFAFDIALMALFGVDTYAQEHVTLRREHLEYKLFLKQQETTSPID